MENYRIFSRRTMGLDNRVWRAMLTLIILSTILFGYKIINRKQEGCVPFTFKILSRSYFTDSNYYTGESISFSAAVSLEQAVRLKWEFSDGIPDTSTGSFVRHIFTKEGRYRVSANIEDGCSVDSVINVKSREIPDSIISLPIKGELITIPDKEEIYTTTLNATSYEWIILNNERMKEQSQHEKTATFQFEFSGTYTIQLTLDKDPLKRYVIDVIVLPKTKGEKDKNERLVIPPNILPIPIKKPDPIQPTQITPSEIPPIVPTKKPDKNKIMGIDEELFKEYLQDLVKNNKDEQFFYKYLCGDGSGSIPVIINGKNKGKNFSALCNEIRGKKSGIWGVNGLIEIEEVKLIRDDKCVIKIEVKY